MAIRNDVKNAIKTVVLKTDGVTNVQTFRPKIKQTEYPLVVVSLSKAHETRASAGAPTGKKHIKYTAQLEIFAYDYSGDGSGQLTFDDLLDAIDVSLRSDPQLGGVALGFAIEHIDTTVAPPQLINQTVAMLALKQFDVTVQVTG